MPPVITPSVVPTGGAIALNIVGSPSGAATLVRTASGAASGVIYSGNVLSYFLDLGDGLPGPLPSNNAYQYQYTDPTGTTTTNWITPSSTIVVQLEPILDMMIRLIQATLNNVTLPAGIKLPQVTNAMPLNGMPPLPMIVVNEQLIQQAEVPIGQSVPHQPSPAAVSLGGIASGYTITGFANRIFIVSALTSDATSRDFFRDMILGMFESIYAPVLQSLGVDVTHDWQATTGQIANDKTGMGPGFFFADIMLQFKGTMNVSIYPGYGMIETITTTVSGGGTPVAVDVIQVPVA